MEDTSPSYLSFGNSKELSIMCFFRSLRTEAKEEEEELSQLNEAITNTLREISTVNDDIQSLKAEIEDIKKDIANTERLVRASPTAMGRMYIATRATINDYLLLLLLTLVMLAFGVLALSKVHFGSHMSPVEKQLGIKPI